MTSEPLDAPNKEALEYWGYLLKPDKCGVDLFNRLLEGIANFICTHFEPTDNPDLTPSQLAAFYRAVGGQYDVLFAETPPSSIAFIYKSLGCLHSLQPTPTDDGYESPTIPALKKKGFITWQTIQLLLCPEEHVPFLQKSVLEFDIIDPATGKPFPKLLPKESFPLKPDPAMVQWYEGVAERLRKEAEAEEQKGETTKVDVDVDEPRMPSDSSADNSADERHGAEAYFRDPLYRDRRARPTIIRTYSRNPPRSPRQFVEDRGRHVANSVRHFWSPFGRRRSLPDRHPNGEVIDDDATPTAAHSQTRYPPKRPPPQRRESSLSSTDPDSDVASHPGNPESPVLRHRRSHEPPPSPREYFPAYVEPRRYSHDNRYSEPPGYGPTKAPIFATHVANLQAHKYYDRQPSMPARPSYPRHSVRYTAQEPSPRTEEPPIIREPYEYAPRSSRRPSGERERDRDRDRERDRRVHRYVTPVDGVGGRRYPVEAPWR